MNDKYKEEEIEKTNIKKYRMEGNTFEKRWFPNVQWRYTAFQE